MSIVQLKKITVYGSLDEKDRALDKLQTLGCLHLTPLTVQDDLLNKSSKNPPSHAKEALKHLKNCSHKLKQIKDETLFNPAEVEKQILLNKHAIEEIQDEYDTTRKQIQDLEPWGSFVLPDPKEIQNQKLWFYVIPHLEMKNIPVDALCFQQVNKDNLNCYVVVISENEPESVPGTQVKLARIPLNALKKRLEQIEFKLEDLQMERINLTRWLDQFKHNLATLEDQASLNEAKSKTFDTSHLFALQGWIPSSEIENVQKYAQNNELAVQIETPQPNETPPTLLHNKTNLSGGQDLLSFYMTPNYWLWDPSTTVFFSFAIFFAMIFSDAGYAIILGSILGFYWKRMGQSESGKRFRMILLALTAFSVVWGILVGSYFGIELPKDSFLGKLKIINMSDYGAMMELAIFVGIIHIIIANFAQAWAKRKSPTAIASLGWGFSLVGVSLIFFGTKYPEAFSWGTIAGYSLIAAGLIAVIGFTSVEKPAWKRLLSGFIGLTRVSGMFGDVLSYLRLFALGLASASLAGVFNGLAKNVYDALPGFKILFALLILVLGHSMNFLLSLMSGFIHGLRLNYIEFFNWSLPEEGPPFKAFSKKETSKWNQ